jgi:hypothetical protein
MKTKYPHCQLRAKFHQQTELQLQCRLYLEAPVFVGQCFLRGSSINKTECLRTKMQREILAVIELLKYED